jgi:hypothetical protein
MTSTGTPAHRITRQSAGFVYASLRVFDLSLGEMLWSRRTVFMGLVVGLPVVIAAVLRLLYEAGAPGSGSTARTPDPSCSA